MYERICRQMPRARKPPSKCSVPSCQNRAQQRGWCDRHHNIWRRFGSPEAPVELRPRAKLGEAKKFFAEQVMTYEGDECLLWPFGNGAGYAAFGPSLAHQQVCEAVHGPRPSPRHEASHSCGKGHLGCVTKRHLRWATTLENQRDRLLHGTTSRGEKSGMSKLTEAQVRLALSLKGERSQSDIADMLEVSQPAISAIFNGYTWGWLTGFAP